MSQLPRLSDAKLEVSERVATLTFNRHDVRNALTGTALIDDIIAVADWVNHEPAVSVLVMTGTKVAGHDRRVPPVPSVLQ